MDNKDNLIKRKVDRKVNQTIPMLRHPTQPIIVSSDKVPRQQNQMAKSTLMSSILGGANVSQPNSHFIDSLQRFKKDYSVYDKEARELERQKKLRILEERKNLQLERESRIRKNQFEYDQKNMEKIQQSRHLCELGLKKTGFSNGLPMNPITLQYHQNPFGSQQQFTDQEIKLRKLVRAHHIQNASTCGYNLINGQGLPPIDPLVPKNTEGRLQEKLGKFYDTKRLNPNVDLGLNPKYVLPKHIGQAERGNQSPIKTQKWQDDEGPEFQSSYKNHFNEKPHEVMANSRMEQSNLYRHYMEQSMLMKAQKSQVKQREMQGSLHNPMQGQMHSYPQQGTAENYMPREGSQYYQMKQERGRQQNNENINPYMQDTVFKSQMLEMRR